MLCYLSQNPHGKAETEAHCDLLEFYQGVFLRNILESSLQSMHVALGKHIQGTSFSHPAFHRNGMCVSCFSAAKNSLLCELELYHQGTTYLNKKTSVLGEEKLPSTTNPFQALGDNTLMLLVVAK